MIFRRVAFFIFYTVFFSYPVVVFSQSPGDNSESQNSSIIFNDEFMQLKKKLWEIEDSVKNINQEINQINENLTISLIKKTKHFNIKFIELSLEGELWYRESLSPQDNEFLENNSAGKNLKRLFWERGKSNLIIKCFYIKKELPSTGKKKEKEEEDFNITKSFKISTDTKISNLLSIIISEKKDSQNSIMDQLDLEINFW